MLKDARLSHDCAYYKLRKPLHSCLTPDPSPNSLHHPFMAPTKSSRIPLSRLLNSRVSFNFSTTRSICSFSNLGLQYGISYSLFEVSNSNHASRVQSRSSI